MKQDITYTNIAYLEVIPYDRGICSTHWVMRLSLSIRITDNIQVLGKLNIILGQTEQNIFSKLVSLKC